MKENTKAKISTPTNVWFSVYSTQLGSHDNKGIYIYIVLVVFLFYV